jgi:hypothetical protein
MPGQTRERAARGTITAAVVRRARDRRDAETAAQRLRRACVGGSDPTYTGGSPPRRK